MPAYLFTYGTLRPGYAPPEIAPAVDKLRFFARGFLRGTLYNLGGYPGALLDPGSPRTIPGVILEFPADPGVLPALDRYEGFDQGSPETSLFLRELHPVTMESGQTLPCWVYVYNGHPDPARIIPGFPS